LARTTSPTSHSADYGETRCECGQLIAKVHGQGLDLKCKRCKRIVVIPFSSIKGWSTVTSRLTYRRKEASRQSTKTQPVVVNSEKTRDQRVPSQTTHHIPWMEVHYEDLVNPRGSRHR